MRIDMIKLDNYREIVGDKVFSIVYRKMRKLYGKHMLHINSTYIGGGVAEILSSLVPLMNDVGLDAGWRTIHGNVDYYGITKKFHNALQGEKINFSDMKKSLYVQTNEQFSQAIAWQISHVDACSAQTCLPQPEQVCA